MKNAPYSLQEAENLCSEYQYLLGRSFAKEDNIVIECVTIAPFDAASRQRFLIFYFLFNNAQKAISQEFKGMLYEVLVIARSLVDEHELKHAELSTWILDNAQAQSNAPVTSGVFSDQQPA